MGMPSCKISSGKADQRCYFISFLTESSKGIRYWLSAIIIPPSLKSSSFHECFITILTSISGRQKGSACCLADVSFCAVRVVIPCLLNGLLFDWASKFLILIKDKKPRNKAFHLKIPLFTCGIVSAVSTWSALNLPQPVLFFYKYSTTSLSVILLKSMTSFWQLWQKAPRSVVFICSHRSWQGLGMLIWIEFRFMLIKDNWNFPEC